MLNGSSLKRGFVGCDGLGGLDWCIGFGGFDGLSGFCEFDGFSRFDGLKVSQFHLLWY